MGKENRTTLGLWRRRLTSQVAAALAVVALCLRLASPMPAPAKPDFDWSAALGEHALCLAAAAGADQPPAPGGRAPAQPGDHPDHDGLGCCPWHLNAGFILPGNVVIGRIAYRIRAAAPAVAVATLPGRVAGPAQARAPPIGG